MKASRRGKTLIELSVVVAITSVAMMLSATTLIALFRVEQQVRSATLYQTAIARLSSQWRADVHAAARAETNQAVRLTMPDSRTIHYAVENSSVTREVRRQDQLLHRDAYVLAPQSQIQFLPAGEAKQPLLRIVIAGSASPQRRHQAATRPLTIAAALNLHRAASAPGEAP